MRGLRLTPAVHEHFRAIRRYTLARFGRAQADQYEDKIAEGLDLILRYPEIGLTVDQLQPGLRRFQIAQHRVFYRVTSDAIEIKAVLHESQLPERHFTRFP